ncbi:MAG: TetR/AcrR family transcriptional regulator [Blastochloris sp.]|nr:TetR/AcrR family transcriptional regulator [Blastochloris sp.]
MNIVSSHEVHASHDTRQRILDSAESLFAENGFEATSLRAITSVAGVNLASVNYHFGSKDNLIVEVLARAIRPLNEQRLHLLDLEIKKNRTSNRPPP